MNDQTEMHNDSGGAYESIKVASGISAGRRVDDASMVWLHPGLQ
jgi:hypothetical protein